MPKLNYKMTHMNFSVIVQINNKARELKAAGKKIVNFSIGIPNFLPPKHVYDAAHDAVTNDAGTYLPNRGSKELVDAFVYRLKEDGFNYKSEEICAGIGAKNILSNLFTIILDFDDEVIFPAPYWSSYIETVEIAYGVCKPIPCTAEQNYKLTPEQLEAAITPRTKVFLFNNPSNPTGMVYSEAEIKALGDVLERHDIWIISDDIYDKMIYDGMKFHHLLDTNPDLRDRTCIVQSISKTYGMPGWRVGMLAAPKKLIDAMLGMTANTLMNIPGVCMAAAAAAFSGDQSFVAEQCKNFAKKRDLVMDTLNAIEGMKCPFPNGAFYAFPNVAAFIGKSYKGETITDDVKLCEMLLEHKGLAVVPGSAFGDDQAFRISYACPEESLAKGLQLLTDFFSKVK